MTSQLMEYFNKSPRIGILSTADKTGKVDSGIFGSPHMTDEKTVVMGLSNNRTLSNLQQNPHAVFLIVEPGSSLMDWKGIRTYLVAQNIATSGQILERFKTEMAKIVGEEASNMIDAVVTFEVTEIRPIVDRGQGWEKSIEIHFSAPR